MRIVNTSKGDIAVLARDEPIKDVRQMLDMMADAGYNGCDGILIYKESLPEGFFDLKTGLAGEILQKFSNYNMKIAIIGDFSGYRSKALSDFIRESNRGGRVLFKMTYDEAIAALQQK